MASDDNAIIKLQKVQHSGELTPERIPTVTIKKLALQTTMDADTVRSSYTPSQGSYGILTYLHLATNAEKTSYALADRTGTFDVFHLGTTATYNRIHDVTLQGDLAKPIHVIRGTFNVYNTVGSYTGGSFTIAWEVVKV